MNTPVIDFVKEYTKSGFSRFHMPGHKGKGVLGFEGFDITEIKGAGNVFCGEGIIAESEQNATSLFGFKSTLYCTEGSTQCIKAMLYLARQAALKAGNCGKRVLAVRNIHKAFVFGCFQNDIDVSWLNADCNITYDSIKNACDLTCDKPFALYVTSPDYYGKVLNIPEIAKICEKLNLYLLVDNAHGAYLRFLSPSKHPASLGAFMSADSAHKTLPVLTGGAYLQLSDKVPEDIANKAKASLSLFCSTSPSYLILQSLDGCNAYLADGYGKKLELLIQELDNLKEKLKREGWEISRSDPLRLVIKSVSKGYTGYELAELLEKQRIQCEFGDFENLVLMFTPENTYVELNKLEKAITAVPPSGRTANPLPKVKNLPKRVLSVRQAISSESECVEAEKALGRICAIPLSPFPPEVPIAVSGEEIDENIISLMKAYGIKSVWVVKE